MQPKRLEFPTTDGTTLRGDLYDVEGTGNAIVIMTAGLSMLKEHYLPKWANSFQEAGFAAFIYDHRGWGSSDGSPRNAVDPMQQAEDYHDAVLFVQSLPSVDPARVIIWGIGHSGGAAMIAAGDDPNIRAAMIIMPFMSGALDASTYPEGALQSAWNERKARLKDGSRHQPSFVQVWDDSEEQANGPRNGVLLHGSGAYKFIAGAQKLSLAAGTAWQNKLTLESLYHISKVESKDHIHKISVPILYLAASVDPLSGPFDQQKETFKRATTAYKEFVALENEHIQQYFSNYGKCIGAQLQWLKKTA